MKALLKYGLPLALLIFVAAPGAVGFLSHGTFVAATDNLTRDLLANSTQVEAGATQRGWFRSRRVLRFSPKHQEFLDIFFRLAGKPVPGQYAMETEYTWNHGPVTFSGGVSTGVGALGSRFFLVSGDERLTLPFTVDSFLGPLRSRHVGKILPVDWQDPGGESLNLSGGEFEGRLANDGSSGTYRIELGELALTADALSTTLSGLAMDGDFDQVAPGLFTGDYAGAIGKLHVTQQNRKLELEDVALETTARLEGSEYVVNVQLNAGGARGDGFSSDGVKLRVFGAANAEALTALYGALSEQAMLDAQPDTDVRNAIIGALLPPVINAGFRLAGDEIFLNLDGDTLTGTIQASVPATEPGTDILQALTGGSGSAVLRIPKSFMERFLTTSPDQRRMLLFAVQSGFILREGDNYVADVEYASRVLKLNGLPLPVPF